MASACIAYDQYAGLQVGNGGNILSKKEYAYTTGTLGTVQDTISYGYGDSAWKDLLTSYDGQTLTADAIGNLTTDGRNQALCIATS